MNLTARKILRPFHLWAGLTLGLILIVMAVTGALLVWRGPIEKRLDQKMFVVSPGSERLAPDDLIARARAAHPVGEFESVRFYGDPTAPFLAYFSNKDYVHVNPYTGEVLGTRPRYGVSMGWIEGLHKFLHLEPSVGEPITGYTALVFGLIILSGVVLWWPATRRALKAGLTINRQLSGRPWNLSLHKAIGAYAAVVLLVTVTTGVPISLDWAKNLLYTLTGSVKTVPPMPVDPAGKFIGFGAVARSMATVMPAAQETYIPLPKKGLITAYSIEADAAHPNARSYLWLDSATAKILQPTPYRQAGTGFRLYYWGMSLHTGVMGGPVVQLFLLLGALAVPVLAYTGTASFLRRKYASPARPAPKTGLATTPAGDPKPVSVRD